MVYTTRGKCNVYDASRVSVFLKKVFECEDCAEDCELNQTILLLPSVMIVYFVQ